MFIHYYCNNVLHPMQYIYIYVSMICTHGLTYIYIYIYIPDVAEGQNPMELTMAMAKGNTNHV